MKDLSSKTASQNFSLFPKKHSKELFSVQFNRKIVHIHDHHFEVLSTSRLETYVLKVLHIFRFT